MKNAFFALIVFITSTLPLMATPVSASGSWNVDASGFANLSTALASPATIGKTVVVSKPMDINSKNTDRAITFTPCVKINIARGKIFTVNGPLEVGLSQAFSGLGKVSGLKESRPEWFGSNHEPGTTDMAPAIQKAADSLVPTGVLKLSSTTYRLNTLTPYTIPVKPSAFIARGEISSTLIKLTGSKSILGTGGSVLKIGIDDKFYAAITMIGDYETNHADLMYGPSGSYVTGITIVGTATATDPATQFGGGIRIISGKDVQVFNCRFKDLRGIGINAVGVNDIYNEGIKAHHNYIYNCHGDGIYYFLAHHSDITDNQVFDSGFTDSIIFEAVQFGKVMNNHIYHSTNRGILINTGSDNCVVSGNTIIQNKADNGIFLTSVRRCVVASNYIWSETGNWAGITTDQGMYSWKDSYHIIQGNIIRNASPGIRISTDYNSITDNMIFSGTDGIVADGGHYNTLRDNDTHAKGYGIKLRGKDGRTNPIGTVVLNNRTDRIDDAGTNSTKLGNIFSNGPVSGKATLVAGTAKVNTAEVLPVDTITLTRSVAGGNVGHLSVGTIVAGTSFVINSSSPTDTSTIFWEIRH